MIALTLNHYPHWFQWELLQTLPLIQMKTYFQRPSLLIIIFRWGMELILRQTYLRSILLNPQRLRYLIPNDPHLFILSFVVSLISIMNQAILTLKMRLIAPRSHTWIILPKLTKNLAPINRLRCHPKRLTRRKLCSGNMIPSWITTHGL